MEIDKRSQLYECLFNCPYNGRCSICPTHFTKYSQSVKHGRWLKTGQSFVNPNKFRNYFCSERGTDLDEHIRSKPNYCPNCGAKMDEDRDYERAVEQLEHDMTFEPTYNPEDGSM